MTPNFRHHGIYNSHTLDLSFESQLFTAESIDVWLLRNAEGMATQRLKRKESILLHGVQTHLPMRPNFYNMGRTPIYVYIHMYTHYLIYNYRPLLELTMKKYFSLLLNSIFTSWLAWYLRAAALRNTVVTRKTDYCFQDPLIYHNINEII